MKVSILSAVLLCAGLVACGSKRSSEQPSSEASAKEGHLHNQKFDIISGELSRSTGEHIEGSAALVFVEPIAEVSAARSFRLKFQLDTNKSLRLTAFSDKKLNNGVNIAFSHTAHH